MDLVKSGAIFNFKPINFHSRNDSKDESLNSLSRSASKSHSRFEELFLASPRAQELVSTIDTSFSFTSSRSINSSYKQHDSIAQSSFSSNSGLVVNMLEFLKTEQRLRSNETVKFSPLKMPDFDEDSLRTQVRDVIDKLRTPTNIRAEASNYHCRSTQQSCNADSGYGDKQMKQTVVKIPADDIPRNEVRSKTSSDLKQILPESALNSEDVDIDVGELSQQSNPIGPDSNPENAELPNKLKLTALASESEEEDISCDMIPESDIPERQPVEDKNQKPLPAEVLNVQSAPQEQSNKKPHHLFGWYIKAIKTKTFPRIIVEGQRHEDPVGDLWHSTEIISRISPSLVQTKSNSQYVLEGEILAKETMEQGFSKQFVKAFKNGFPSNWEQIVKDHFDSTINSSIKNEKQQKITRISSTKVVTHPGRKPQSKAQKTPKREGGKPIEVELKRTSSGRLVKPPLAWWRGQRILTDNKHNLTAIEPGGEEHTSLSNGLYDFDLKLPKGMADLMGTRNMTPKVFKYDVRAADALKNTNNRATRSKVKYAKKNVNKGTVNSLDSRSYDGSESELTDCTSQRTSNKIKETIEKPSSSQTESDLSSFPGVYKASHVMTDESWRPSESDSTAKEGSEAITKSKKLQSHGNTRLTRSQKQQVEFSTEEECSVGKVIDKEDNATNKESVKKTILFSDDEPNSRLKSSQKKEMLIELNANKKVKNSASRSSKQAGKIIWDKSQCLTRSMKQKVERQQLDSNNNIQNKAYNTEESDSAHSSDIYENNATTKIPSKKKFNKPKAHDKNKNPKPQNCSDSSDEENIQPQRSLRSRNHLKSQYKEDSSSVSDEDDTEAVAKMLSSVRQRKAEAQSRETSDTDSSKNKLRTRTKKKAQNRRPKLPQKQKDLRKGNRSNEDESDWTDIELLKLSKALHSIPLSTPNFWQKISDSVQTRTAKECQLQYDDHLNMLRPRKVVQTKEKQSKVNPKVVAVTGRVGTIKRKRELRQLIQQHNDGYEDDIFESTPYKSTKKFKLLAQNNQDSEGEKDDENEDDVDDKQIKNTDFKTPSSRTPSSRYRPLGPASSSKTPSSDLISPSLLQPVNRQPRESLQLLFDKTTCNFIFPLWEGMDLYIHRMKQSKKAVGVHGKRDPIKMVKTSTPKKKVTSHIPKTDGSIFDVEEVLEEDSDEENDYYWSDE